MPYDRLTTVLPTSSFPFTLFPGMIFHFLKGVAAEIPDAVADELIAKQLVTRVFLNKAEGPSIYANADNGPSRRARDNGGAKSSTKNRSQ